MQRTYEVVSCNWKKLMIRGICGLSIPLISIIYTHLNQYRGTEKVLSTFIDDFIPFCKFFSIPYILWYGYVAVFLGLLCIFDEENYFRLLIGLDIGMLICYLIYYLFPTYVPRPNIYNTDFFTNIVCMVYKADNPYNCFPSIHVLNSLLVALHVNKTKELSKEFKLTSSIFAIMIILSTMFVKQHYIVDAIASTALAYIIYFLMRPIKIKI